MSRSNLGFTLIELLIVFSLLGLALSFVVPLGIDQLDKIRQKSDEKTTLSLARAAVDYAFWTNQAQTLTFDNNTVMLAQNSETIRTLELNTQVQRKEEFTISPSGEITGCIESERLQFLQQALTSLELCSEQY
ncbi:hypothetical protein CWC31_06685 [Pseudoalteromonas ruthenica]|uniref:pilus assembly FimT family protein n=1 Tax=Pseudoalteromonas ruthenica TaxID=151081 RepID=UPI001107C6BF|nr:type II secretion system protein [Pseudoalteromonas ruthenica]TLX51297.1 hypothetical protein CWC31_06685 [Pseudoalteromonas ruthenica]|tara:strand:+ start:24929 stop:25327 length:399 start_codon:yes stop_codon:yes gene_type:complete